MSDQGLNTSYLTHGQLQIWIGQRRNPESPLYNMAFAFVFDQELRTDVFCEAWQRVVRSSEALRTYVIERDGVAQRALHPQKACRTEVLDLAALPSAVSEGDGSQTPRSGVEQFRRFCQERCSRPLSLTGELVDSVLVDLGAGRTGWYLNLHHLITDAGSTVLLYRQVAAEYEMLLGARAETSELFNYYSTVASLETGKGPGSSDRARSYDPRLAAQEHWARRSAGEDRSASFYGRPSRATVSNSTRYTLELDESRSCALDRLAGQDGFASFSPEMSRFTVLATVLVAFLHRVTGQTSLGFDAPVSGRPNSRAKRSIGLFIEMFPFRASLDTEDTYRTLGAKCLNEAQQFLRHSLPGTSAPSSATAHNVVLNYVPESFGDFAGAPVTADWLHPGHGDSVHALRLQVHDFSGRGRYTLHLDLNDEVLPAAGDQEKPVAVDHFAKVLDACLEDPDQPIQGVDILTHYDLDRLSVLRDPGESPLPSLTVVDRFDQQAHATPERIALRQRNSQGDPIELSFARLDEETSALAIRLTEAGVEPGNRVAILANRSIPTVQSILATLKARAAFVPIDPRYPLARIEQILHDCGARLLLYNELPSNELRELDLDGFLPPDMAALDVRDSSPTGPSDRSKSFASSQPRLDDLAYMIYTSGSTGAPKGVLVEHSGLADYLDWASRLYVRGDQLTFPLFTSLSFDLTLTSLLLPLVTGGTLVVYPEPEGPVDSALMEVAADNTVDFIKLTPSHLSLLRQLDLGGSCLRRMVVGGEDLKTSLTRAISAQYDDRIEIYNEYGPTEAIVGCSVHRFDPLTDTGTSVPIGTPADHVALEILNPALSPVPAGVPGELFIERFGLARGYHGQIELTRQRFLEKPELPDARRYRTGDLVRLDESGLLEYLGRTDRQVKISGMRIEPGEIENALLSHEAVAECVVIAREKSDVHSTPKSEVVYCVRCGLPSNYPRASFDDKGICNVCHAYDSVKERAQAYFKTEDELQELFEKSRSTDAPYDCMMLLSGGKDSTYALCQLVDMGLSVLAFTLDNGFISDGAKDNMRRVTEQLGVPLELASTEAMNGIFRDSLERFSNVCHGCFKTIYTLSTKRAHELGIHTIVTGLSRGQMFETRLTEELFRDGRFSAQEVDAAVLAARKVYHRVNDEVFRSLDVEIFQDDAVFEQIQFVDFYRYCDAGLDEVLTYLDQKAPWVRPADTGRSTNCLINDIGIYVHKKERRFHNYALPYSWDVRLGHKTREQALDELHDEIDLEHVNRTLFDIGYHEATSREPRITLEAFCTHSGREVSEASLESYLTERLPAQLVPTSIRWIDAIPLTENGKLDQQALPSAISDSTPTVFVALSGPVEEYLAKLWQRELGLEGVGAQSNFFELGGTSLGAMEVMVRLCREFDIDLELEALFERPTVRELAGLAERTILEDVSGMSVAEQKELLGE